MSKIALRRLVCAVSFFGLLPAAKCLEVEFDDAGLKSLRNGGVEFLGDGHWALVGATLRRLDGSEAKISPDSTQRHFDGNNHVATLQTSAFTATCTYQVSADRLTFLIDITNTSDATISGLTLQLLDLKFPSAPRGWQPFFPCLGNDLGRPTINVADFGSQTLALCNEDFGRPLVAGFPGRLSLRDRPICVSSVNVGWLSPYLDPLIERPIFPGGVDHYRISLRFADGSVGAKEIAGDLLKKFAAAYPVTLHWSDRRPIGTLFLAHSEKVSPTNPRGWFEDPRENFVSPEGRAKFARVLLHYADESIRVLKGMNAQGMILWDGEGEQFPHATSYLGDPRSLPPEMESVIDAFFKKFSAAGFRVGLCVRPQRPVRPAYGETVFQIDTDDVEKNMAEKIDYARKRWGCTLFYVDSNGDPNVPIDALIFKRLAAAYPDVLLMPEQKNPLYYAYTAPFHSFFHQGVASTPELVRAIYPDAFGVIYAPDGPIDERRADLVAAVRRGDILLFHGWYDNANNAKLKAIYDEAHRR